MGFWPVIISIGMPSDLTNGINGREIRIGQSFAADGKLGFMAPNDASNADVWTATSSALAIGEWTHLALERNDNGELQLVLHQAEATLVLQTDLVAVSEECADCTTALDAQPFPRLIRLATFQHEYGAH